MERVLSVRLGPFAQESDARRYLQSITLPAGASARLTISGHVDGNPAWWVWVEKLRNVSRPTMTKESEGEEPLPSR